MSKTNNTLIKKRLIKRVDYLQLPETLRHNKSIEWTVENEDGSFNRYIAEKQLFVDKRITITREEYDTLLSTNDLQHDIEYTVLEPDEKSYSRYIGEIPLATGGGTGPGTGALFTFRLEPQETPRQMEAIVGGSKIINYYFENADEFDMSPGVLSIIKNREVVRFLNIPASQVGSIDIGPYILEGNNEITLEVRSADDITRKIPLFINGSTFSISTRFDETYIYTASQVIFPYYISGPGEKTLYFETYNEFTERTRTQSLIVMEQSRDSQITLSMENGPNKVKMFSTVIIDGTVVATEIIESIAIVNVGGAIDYPILASKFQAPVFTTNDIVEIDFLAYQYGKPSVSVLGILNNDEATANQFNVAPGEWGKWVVGFLPEGTHNLLLAAEGAYLSYDITVNQATEGALNTDDESLQFYLTALGRSNQEPSARLTTWENRGTHGTTYPFLMEGFNFASNGWINNKLIFNGRAQATLDYKPFATNVSSSGMTIEIELDTPAIHDGSNIIECLDAGVGFAIKSNKASFIPRANGNRVDTFFGEDEKVKVSFVVSISKRRLFIYINGVLTSESIIESNITTNQRTPQPIKFNIPEGEGYKPNFSVYNVRVYNRELSAEEITNNYIHDIPDATEKIEEFNKNQVYTNNMIDADKVQDFLPIMIIDLYGATGNALPQDKDYRPAVEKITYTNKFKPHLDFVRESTPDKKVTIQTQGTSTLQYPIKNYRFKGDILKEQPVYLTEDGSRPATVLNIKADYTDSSLATNSTLVRMFETMYTKGTPPMELQGTSPLDKFVEPGIIKNPYGIRTTIFAGITAVFHRKTRGGRPEFVGLYSLNNDKSEPAVYGHGVKDLENQIMFPDSKRFEIAQNKGDDASAFVKKPITDKFTEEDYLRELITGFDIMYPEVDSHPLIEKPTDITPENRDEIYPYYEELDNLITFISDIPLKEEYTASSKLTADYLINNLGFEANIVETGEVIEGVDEHGNPIEIPVTITLHELEDTNTQEKFSINLFERTIEFTRDGSVFQSETLQTALNTLINNKYIDFIYNVDITDYTELNDLKQEFEARLDLDYITKYFLVASMFGLLDSFGKNVQMNTWNKSEYDPVSGELVTPAKWYFTFYDLDTAVGVDNQGRLTDEHGNPFYDYNIELEYGGAFAQSDSKIWKVFASLYKDHIKYEYQQMRLGNLFNTNNVFVEFFDKSIDMIGTALYNESNFFKYVDSPNTAEHVTKMHGDRKLQIKGWLTNRFKFLDSKYIVGVNAANRQITARLGQDEDTAPELTVVPHFHQYITIQFGNPNIPSFIISERTEAHEPVTILSPHTGTADFMETGIYGAENISTIENINRNKISTLHLGNAINLTRIDLSKPVTDEALGTLTFGDNRLLEYINLENLSLVASSFNFTNLAELRYLNMRNTSIPSIILPKGGILETLILPDSIRNFNLESQHYLTDVQYGNLNNLQEVIIDDTPIDILELLNSSTSEDIILRVENFKLSTNDKDWLLNLAHRLYDTETQTFKVAGVERSGDITEEPLIYGEVIIKTNEDYTPEEYELFNTVFGDRLNIDIISSMVGFDYSVVEDGPYAGNYVINGFSAGVSMPHIKIPVGSNPILDSHNKVYIFGDTVEWTRVVGIAENAFRNDTNIISVELPSSVEFIGDQAFLGCTELQTINLPNNLKEIGQEAFYLAENLSLPRFPQNLTTVGDGAFNGIKHLHKFIYLTGTLETLGRGAFGGTGLEDSILFLSAFPENNQPVGWDAGWNQLESTKYEIMWDVDLQLRRFSFNTLEGGENIPVVSGYILEELPEAVRKGYTHVGWLFNDETINTPYFIPPRNTSQSISLTADYIRKRYTITYHNLLEEYGAEYVLPEDFDVTELPVVLPTPTVTPNYVYSFNNWHTAKKPSVSNKIVEIDFAKDVEPHNIELWADWDYESFDINYRNIEGAEKYNYNEIRFNISDLPITLDMVYDNATHVPYEHHFIAWYTELGNLDTEVTQITTPGNKTLYAGWGKQYRMATDQEFAGNTINTFIYRGRLTPGNTWYQDKYVIIPEYIKGVKAHFTPSYSPSSNLGIFANSKVIGFKMEAPENLESMRGFFNGSTSEHITLEDTDVSKVQRLYYTFNAINVTSLNLTSNVGEFSELTTLYRAFGAATIVNLIGIESIDTSKVIDLQHIFYFATIGNSILDLSNWDTTKVQLISYAFYAATLNTLNLSNFKISSSTPEDGIANITSLERMFTGAKINNLVGLETWNTKQVASLAYMFLNLTTQSTLNINNWDLTNVTNMDSTFYNASIPNLIINNWAPQRVSTLNGTFYGMKIDTLNLNSWDTSKVTSLYRTFGGTQINTLHINTWDTSSVTNMSRLFEGAKINNLDISKFDTSNVTDMSRMFASFQSGITLDLSTTYDAVEDKTYWDMSKVTDMSYMFQGVGVYIDNYVDRPIIILRDWKLSKVQNMGQLFRDSRLRKLDVFGWDFSENFTAIDSRGMFTQVRELPLIDMSTWDTSLFTSFNEFFGTYQSYTTDLRVTSTVIFNPNLFSTENATSFYRMFYDFRGKVVLWDPSINGEITETDINNYLLQNQEGKILDLTQLPKFRGVKATNFQAMFRYSDILEMNLTDLVQIGTTLSQMFYSSDIVTVLGMNTWDTSNVTNTQEMFQSSDIVTLDLSSWDISNITSFSQMFYGANATTINVTNWGTVAGIKVGFKPNTSLYRLFYNSKATTIIGLDTWDTENVSDMGSMFYRAQANFVADIKDWDMSNVTDMSYMFRGATNITTLAPLVNWDTSNVTNMNYTFASINVIALPIAQWDLSSLTSVEGMFSGIQMSSLNVNFLKHRFPYLTTIEYLFDGAKINNLTLDEWDETWSQLKTTSLRYTFGLTTDSLDLTHLDTSKITSMYGTFSGLSIADSTNFDISTWNTSNVTNMSWMFTNTTLTNLDVSHFDMRKVTTVQRMFSSSGITVNISGWEFNNVVNMSYMFYNTTTVNPATIVGIDTWKFSETIPDGSITMASMFYSRHPLNIKSDGGTDLTTLPMRKVWNTSSMFATNTNAGTLDFDSEELAMWDMSNVTNMDAMFRYRRLLSPMVLDRWDLSSLQTARNMFYETHFSSVLNKENRVILFPSLKLNIFENTSGALVTTDISYMFYYSRYLNILDVSGVRYPEEDAEFKADYMISNWSYAAGDDKIIKFSNPLTHTMIQTRSPGFPTGITAIYEDE